MTQLADSPRSALVLSAAEALAATPFFAGLSSVDLARLVPELEERHVAAGEAVFCHGMPGDGLYLIRSGTARVSVVVDGVSEVVAYLEAPAYFGEMALLSDESRSASVEAISPLSLWKLPRERFDALVSRHPRLPLELAAEVTRRLAETTRKLSHSQHEVAEIARGAYTSLDASTQALLRRAAIVEEGDAELLRDIVGPAWSDVTFERLVQESVFFNGTAREGWVRFSHEAVRELLLDELTAEVAPDQLADARCRGAEALLERGDDFVEMALELLALAGAWERLAELLESRGQRLVEHIPDRVESYLRALPESVLWTRPSLVRLLARSCQQQGRLAQAVEAYVDAARRAPAARVGPIAVEFQQALADLYERLGRHDEALACLRRAVELRGPGGRLDGAADHGGHMAADLPHGATHRGRLELAGARGVAAASLANGDSEPRRRPRQLAALSIVALTVLIWFLPPPAGLSQPGLRVLATVVASISLAFLQVIPEYVVALLMVAAWVVTNTLPPKVAAAGFSSPTWFLLMASMAVGTAVARSGLLYRGAIEIVRRLPPSHVVRCLTLAGLGVLFSPGMPNPVGRVSLAAPLAQDIADSLRYAPRSGGSAALALATFVGFGMMGTLFLTGSALSLIVYGLLPPDVQTRMSWVSWFVAALPSHLIIFGLTMGMLLVRFRPRGEERLSAETLALQREVLGRLSREEWSALVTLGLLLVGFSTQSLHRVDPAWLGIGAVVALFVTGALDDAMFKNGVNLSFLLYLGVVMGFREIFAHLELDRWLSQNLEGLATVTGGSQALFVLVVAALAAAFGIVLRPGPISILLGLALYPTATAVGVSPWIVAYTTLLASNLWLYPQQNMMYLTTYYGTEERAFSHAQARPLALGHALFVFISILVSIPYWRWLGLIE